MSTESRLEALEARVGQALSQAQGHIQFDPPGMLVRHGRFERGYGVPTHEADAATFYWDLTGLDLYLNESATRGVTWTLVAVASGLTNHIAAADDHTGYLLESLFDALGDIVYASADNTPAKLAGQITTTKKFLQQTGNGAVSAAPAWDTIADGDVPATHSGTAHHAEAHTVASHSDANEGVQDIVGAMLTGNTETDIAVTYQDADGTIDFVVNQTPTRSIILSAAGGAPTTTAGCADSAKVEAGTNDVDYWVLDFDSATQEYAFWNLVMPDNYDAGTLTARFVWTAASGSGGVRWGIAILARSDDDAIDTAYGTAQEVSDTLLAAVDVHISAATAAITPGGTAAAGDMFFLRVYRLPSHADDTLAVDARLLQVKIEYTTSSYSD